MKSEDLFNATFINIQRKRIERRIKRYQNKESISMAIQESGFLAENPYLPYINYKQNAVVPFLKIALEKIQDGSYGFCLVCNKQIDIKRLKIVPGALKCASCAKRA